MLTKIEKIPEQKKIFFLLHFAIELIKNSRIDDIFQLEKALKEKETKEKKEIFEKIKEREISEEASGGLILTEIKKEVGRGRTVIPALRQIVQKRSPQILKIPEPKLPPRFQYLKPMPTDVQIDLGKLNSLRKDPAVRSIECNGPDEKILVLTTSKKITGITLSKEEINEIIKNFSELSKIPADEGVFRAAVGKLIILAIISDVIGSKFIIRKIPSPQLPVSGIFPGARLPIY